MARWGVGGAPARVRFTVSWERRSWARRVARIFAEPSGALSHDRKIGAPVGDAGASSRSTPFLRTAAAAAGGAAQLRGREHPSKIGRLAHHNFAQCGVGGRWRARALHACMCARALEMPFSSTFSAAAGVTELLRGWDVAQRLARLALSHVAERGMGSRGRVGCGAFAMTQ